MTETERVIILKATKYSESDLILNTISSGGEILNFIARGAQKSKKRFVGGILEPTRFVKVSFRRKHDEASLHYLNEAQLLEGFEGIRLNYERLEMAFHFLKLILKMSHQGHSDESIFLLLGGALRALETDGDVGRLKTCFEAQLLNAQGVCPSEVYEGFFRVKLKDYKVLSLSHENWQRQAVIVSSSLRNYLS